MALSALAGVGALAGVLHDRHTRATVPKVAMAAQRDMTLSGRAVLARRVDGVALPDWSARGWRVVGGRGDVVGGRRLVTARYQRGRQTITYTLVAGSRSVIDARSTWESEYEARGEKLELSWQALPHRLLAARVVPRGRLQFVMTGRPASASLRREMTRLAARSPAAHQRG